MARRTLLAGDTSVIVPVFIQDSTSTTGAGLAGLVYNTSGLTCKYKRRGDSSYTTVTLATATIGTWATGGFKEDTSGPTGSYELHLPNAAVAASAKWVVIELYGATNMVPVKIEIELVAYNPQDAVRLGLAALPNANAGAANGLVVIGTGANKFKSDTSSNVTVGGYASTQDPGTWVLNQSYAGGTSINTLGYAIVNGFVAANNVDQRVTDAKVAFLDAAVSSRMATFTLPTNFSALGINASGHVSRVTLADTLTTYTGNTPQTGDSFARLGAPAGASVSADVAVVTTHLTDLKGSGWVIGDNFHTRLGATPPTAAAIRTEISSNGNHVKVGTAYTHTNNTTAATANVTIS